MSDSQPRTAGEPSPAERARARLARFGAFELDVVTGELRRNGLPVKLQELPFRLLAFLLQRPGELVSREELHERLWPAEFVDFDHSLNTAMRKLRNALDDDADNPRFVETLARRGYRFIAPVTWTGADPEAAIQPKAPAPAAAWPRRYAFAAVVVLVVVASLASIPMWRRDAPPAPQQQASAIAVLPFLAENGAAEHLTDGLSEVLINALSRVTDLRVMGRTTVFRYKDRVLDARAVGRDLNVGAIVTGTVREQDGEQTIHVELLDTADGTRLWGQRYETRGSTLPAVHSRIAEDLTRRLRRGIDRTASARASIRNPRAYELYLQGLQAWNRRTPKELQRAADLLKQAIALDPEFADAHAALANTYGVMVGYEILTPEEGSPLVLAESRAALAIDPSNSGAHLSRAATKFRNFWDYEGAGADYRRALELNPSNATAHQWYSEYLRAMGRFDQARVEVTRAWELDPQSVPVATEYCYDALYRREYEEALSRSRLIPGWSRGNACAVLALAAMGRPDDVLVEMREGQRVPPDFFAVLERAYREKGLRGYQLEILKGLRRRRGAAFEDSVDLAGLYAQLNDRDAAFAVLEKAYAKRASRMTQLHIEPQFDNLRDDPRFEDLVRRVGIPAEALAAADTLRAKVHAR